jgi:predicted ATPase with chaperone activity
VRLRRLARTIADVDGAEAVAEAHLKEAVSYRLAAEDGSNA